MISTRERNGFSLVEMIVAIGLLAILTSIGTVMFFRMSDLWARGRLRVHLDAVAEMALAELRDDCAEIIPSATAGQALQGIEGEVKDQVLWANVPDDKVVLPVLSTGMMGRRSAAAVSYHIDREANALVRTANDPRAETPSPSRAVVTEGIAGLCIEYATGSATEPWVRSWSESRHPEAIRVSVLVVDKDQPSEQVSRKAVFPIHVQ